MINNTCQNMSNQAIWACHYERSHKWCKWHEHGMLQEERDRHNNKHSILQKSINAFLSRNFEHTYRHLTDTGYSWPTLNGSRSVEASIATRFYDGKLKSNVPNSPATFPLEQHRKNVSFTQFDNGLYEFCIYLFQHFTEATSQFY